MRTFKKVYYIVLVLLLTILLFSIPYGYEYLTNTNTEEIKTSIKLSFNDEDISGSLNEVAQNYNFNLVVESDDFFYSSNNLTLEQFDNMTYDENAYVEKQSVNGYNYILVIPPISFEVYNKYFIVIELMSILLILIWAILTIKNISSMLIKPLESLKNNINKIKQFEFNTLNQESQDKINDELIMFSEELSKIIEEYNTDISNSQLSIENKNLIMEKQKQYLITSIHDLKNQVRNIKYSSTDENILNQVNAIISESESIIKNFTTNKNEDFSQKSKIILDQKVFLLIKNFRESLDEKDISLSLKIKDKYLYANEPLVTQLFTNIISNAVNHTNFLGEIEIIADEEYIIFKNSTDNVIDIDKVFNLNYSTSGTDKLGFGMSRIKNLAESLNYDLSLSQEDDMFILKLKVSYYDN